MSKYRTCAFFVDNVRCLWCPVSGHINRSSTLSEVFVGKTIDYRDAAYWKDIVKAKQAFLAGDQDAAEGRVRPLVLESWKRCLPFLGTKLAKKRTMPRAERPDPCHAAEQGTAGLCHPRHRIPEHHPGQFLHRRPAHQRRRGAAAPSMWGRRAARRRPCFPWGC